MINFEQFFHELTRIPVRNRVFKNISEQVDEFEIDFGSEKIISLRGASATGGLSIIVGISGEVEASLNHTLKIDWRYTIFRTGYVKSLH